MPAEGTARQGQAGTGIDKQGGLRKSEIRLCRTAVKDLHVAYTYGISDHVRGGAGQQQENQPLLQASSCQQAVQAAALNLNSVFDYDECSSAMHA